MRLLLWCIEYLLDMYIVATCHAGVDRKVRRLGRNLVAKVAPLTSAFLHIEHRFHTYCPPLFSELSVAVIVDLSGRPHQRHRYSGILEERAFELAPCLDQPLLKLVCEPHNLLYRHCWQTFRIRSIPGLQSQSLLPSFASIDRGSRKTYPAAGCTAASQL